MGDYVMPPPKKRVTNGAANNSFMVSNSSSKETPLPPPKSKSTVNNNTTQNTNAIVLPPPKMAPTLAGLDNCLLRMQKELVSFYKSANPERINKETLCVAVQLWWDSGLNALNTKLSQIYNKTISCQDFVPEYRQTDTADYTIITKNEINDSAANNDFLVLQAMVKKNSGEFFKGDSGMTKSIRIPKGGLNLGNNLKDASFASDKNKKLSKVKDPYGNSNVFAELDDNDDSENKTDNYNETKSQNVKMKNGKKKQKRNKKKKTSDLVDDEEQEHEEEGWNQVPPPKFLIN